MRALTHADKFLCPHGGAITVTPPAKSSLQIGGQPVLLVDELRDATVACPLPTGPCTRVAVVVNPTDLRTQIGSKVPVVQGATVMTDRGPAIAIPAPGPASWAMALAPTGAAPDDAPPEAREADAGPAAGSAGLAALFAAGLTAAAAAVRATLVAAGKAVSTPGEAKPPKRLLAFRLVWPEEGGEPIAGAEVLLEPWLPLPEAKQPSPLALQSDRQGVVRVEIDQGKGIPWIGPGRRLRLIVQTEGFLIVRQIAVDDVAGEGPVLRQA